VFLGVLSPPFSGGGNFGPHMMCRSTWVDYSSFYGRSCLWRWSGFDVRQSPFRLPIVILVVVVGCAARGSEGGVGHER